MDPFNAPGARNGYIVEQAQRPSKERSGENCIHNEYLLNQEGSGPSRVMQQHAQMDSQILVQLEAQKKELGRLRRDYDEQHSDSSKASSANEWITGLITGGALMYLYCEIPTLWVENWWPSWLTLPDCRTYVEYKLEQDRAIASLQPQQIYDKVSVEREEQGQKIKDIVDRSPRDDRSAWQKLLWARA